MQGILIIFGVALAGILAGWFIPGLQKAEKAIGAAQNICLFVLIALMGLKIAWTTRFFTTFHPLAYGLSPSPPLPFWEAFS